MLLLIYLKVRIICVDMGSIYVGITGKTALVRGLGVQLGYHEGIVRLRLRG